MLPRFQVDAGRDLDYKSDYPRGSFRWAIHRLGFELLQILFSEACRGYLSTNSYWKTISGG